MQGCGLFYVPVRSISARVVGVSQTSRETLMTAHISDMELVKSEIVIAIAQK